LTCASLVATGLPAVGSTGTTAATDVAPATRPPTTDSRGAYVTVTYLGNEGVLISGPSGKILIDALVGEGLEGYESLAGRERQHLEHARAPYDDVDLILATHSHADHFDSAAVLRYLESNHRATFASTPQAIERLATEPGFETVAQRVHGFFPAAGERAEVSPAPLHVEALNVTHGPRWPPVQNLGYLIEIDGLRLLHLGDSEADLQDFQGYGLDRARIDVALVPFWYFLSDPDLAAVRDGLRAHTLIPIHIPTVDAPASYFGGPGGRDDLLQRVEAALPNVTAFHAGLRERRFPVRDRSLVDEGRHR